MRRRWYRPAVTTTKMPGRDARRSVGAGPGAVLLRRTARSPNSAQRVGMRIRHGAFLLRDIAWMSGANRIWWLLPLVGLLLLGMVAAGAAHSVVPYAVYTLF